MFHLLCPGYDTTFKISEILEAGNCRNRNRPQGFLSNILSYISAAGGIVFRQMVAYFRHLHAHADVSF